MDEDQAGEERAAEGQWVLLVDPAWRPVGGTEVAGPPLAAVVGGWLAGADGSVSRFEANPVYQPSSPDSPTDPLDASLRLMSRGEVDFDRLSAVLRESVLAVALGTRGEPLVAPAPDDVPSLLVTTAHVHRARVRAESWLEVSAAELAVLLRDVEVDVLINPGAPACTRLLAETVERAVAATT
jgi:hypothetical protein